MHTRRKTDNASLPHPVIKVTLFGEFACQNQNDEYIAITNKRAKAILALLCLTPSEPIQRKVLSHLLWPGRFDAQAKSSLRQCILYLSKLLDTLHPNLLNVSHSHIAIDETLLQTELLSIERALITKDSTTVHSNLIEMGTYHLLEFTEYGGEFTELISLKRRIIERRLKTDIEQYLQSLIIDGETSEFQKISEAFSARPVVIETFGIAIIPIRPIPNTAQQQLYISGTVETLHTVLEQVPHVSLAGTTSTQALNDSDKTIREIAAVLNVKYIVNLSVQCFQNDIHISLQLIDGMTGLCKWEKRYESNLIDIVTFQDTMAQDACSEISAVLSISASRPKIHQITSSQEAYDYYMQGRSLTRRIVGEGVLTAAISLFEKALAIDSQFAKAWSALAEANAYITAFTPCPDKKPYIKRMAQCANTALSIAPTDGLALVMLGVYKWTQNDPLAALDLAYLAHHHEPHNASVSARLGSFLCYCGKTKQAVEYISESADKDPLNGRHLAHLSNILLNMGDIKGARKVASKMSALGFPSIFLGLVTALDGEHELAVKLYSQTRMLMNYVMTSTSDKKPMTEEQQDTLWELASKGVCSGKQADKVNYLKLLEHLHMTLEDKQDLSIVLPAVWMGYAPMVFKTLSKNITPANMPSFGYLWADIAPLNNTVQHPEFFAFAQHIGLTKVWEKYGWPDVLKETKEQPKNDYFKSSS